MASSSPSKRRRSQRLRPWSDGLPDDVLVNILSCLHTLLDFFSFRGVCRNWRNAAKPSPYTLSSQSPLLIIKRRKTKEYIYDVVARRPYRLGLPWYRPDRFTMAYSHGQLIIKTNGNKHGRNSSVLLRDLFTGATTLLPLAPNYFDRIFISARPDSGHCFVVTIFGACGESVQFLKMGDTSWTVKPSGVVFGIVAMTFFQGELFFLSQRMELFVMELKPFRARKLGGGRDFRHADYWLGGCNGVLLAVSVSYPYKEFKVFQWSSEKKGWEDVHDLGNKALFLCNRYLVSVSVTGLELRKNCVYYASYTMKGWAEYSLVDRSYKAVKADRRNFFGLKRFFLPPFWVFPNNC